MFPKITVCLIFFIINFWELRKLKICDAVKSRLKRMDNGEIVNNHKLVPYFVTLQANCRRCGSALIDENILITSAQCIEFVQNQKHADKLVFSLVNAQNWRTIDKISANYNGIAIHNKYNRKPLINDIALIRLVRPFPRKYGAKPIKLPSTNIKPGKKVTVFGTDYLEEVGLSNKKKLFLKFQTTKLLNSCETENVLCAQPGSGLTCYSDKGGPVVLRGSNSDKDVLVGIISWNQYDFMRGCERKIKSIEYYTDVFQYLDWINKTKNRLK